MSEQCERDKLINLVAEASLKTDFISGQVVRLVHFEAARIADGLLAAGYRKTDHIEYAADHLHASVLEFQDEDGNLWTDKAAIREYLDQFRNAKLVQRYVTNWEPVE